MAETSPLDVLRDLAQKALDDAANHLGKTRQVHADALQQRNELINYEQEYRQQLQHSVTDKGLTVISLLNHSAFIYALNSAVEQHNGYVARCEESVGQALHSWRYDWQRLNAFSTLKERADAAQAAKENHQEQKIMDEYAQRACMRRDA